MADRQDAHQKASGNNVHVLRPSAKEVRRISSAKVIAVVGHVLAEVVREIVPAIVAITAENIRPHHHAIAHLERDAFEVVVLPSPPMAATVPTFS